MKDFVSSPGLCVFVLVAPFSFAWVASSILNPAGPGLIGLAGACLTLPAALWLRGCFDRSSLAPSRSPIQAKGR